jgi:putative transposase
MARQKRDFTPGCRYHIYQRGVRRERIFRSSGDALFYLRTFFKLSQEYGVACAAFCLMRNHYHFLLMPDRKDSIPNLFKRLNGIYVNRFNNRYGECGHLFESRPHVIEVEGKYCPINYIEWNPVEAGVVKKKEDYHFSSAHIRWQKFLKRD